MNARPKYARIQQQLPNQKKLSVCPWKVVSMRCKAMAHEHVDLGECSRTKDVECDQLCVSVADISV